MWKSSVVATAVALVFFLLVFFSRVRMEGRSTSPWTEVLFFVGAGVVFATVILDLTKNYKFRKALSARPPRSQEDFVSLYFPDSDSRQRLALQILEVLRKHVDLPLDRLDADEHFSAVTDLDLETMPNFFMELEEIFNFEIPVADAKTFLQSLQSVKSFRDLVDYVESRQGGLTSPFP